jgi:hypothetical protein
MQHSLTPVFSTGFAWGHWPLTSTYLKCIEQVGFLPSSVPVQMHAIARFSNWLGTGQVDLHQVDEATVERFLSVIWMLFMAAKQLLCGVA